MDFVLPTSSIGMDSGWTYQVSSLGGGLLHTTRMFTVTDITTTIYPVVYATTVTCGSPGIFKYSLQCVRID